MQSFGIVCDACGHHTAEAPLVERLAVASQDVALRRATQTKLPTVCPQCGARWDRLQAGDEYLIGLTHVASGSTIGRTAGRA